MRQLFLLLLPFAVLLSACGNSRKTGNTTITFTLEADTASLHHEMLYHAQKENKKLFQERILREAADALKARMKEAGYIDNELEIKADQVSIHVIAKNMTDEPAELKRFRQLLTQQGILSIYDLENMSKSLSFLAAANDTLNKERELARKKNDSIAMASGSLIEQAHFKSKPKLSSLENDKYYLFDVLELNFKRTIYDYPSPVDGVVIGRAAIKDTATFDSIMRLEKVRLFMPFDSRLIWVSDTSEKTKDRQLLLLALHVAVNEQGILDDIALKESRTKKIDNGSYAVEIEMQKVFADIFKKLAAARKNNGIAFRMDEQLLSWQILGTEITDDKTLINGNFTKEEADDLVVLLKSPKLPVRLRIVSEKAQ